MFDSSLLKHTFTSQEKKRKKENQHKNIELSEKLGQTDHHIYAQEKIESIPRAGAARGAAQSDRHGLKIHHPVRLTKWIGKSKWHLQLKRSYWWWLHWCLKQDLARETGCTPGRVQQTNAGFCLCPPCTSCPISLHHSANKNQVSCGVRAL